MFNFENYKMKKNNPTLLECEVYFLCRVKIIIKNCHNNFNAFIKNEFDNAIC